MDDSPLEQMTPLSPTRMQQLPTPPTAIRVRYAWIQNVRGNHVYTEILHKTLHTILNSSSLPIATIRMHYDNFDSLHGNNTKLCIQKLQFFYLAIYSKTY